MSGEILFLAHRIPFPPDRGDKIRSHHILAKLADLAPVHVGTFADDEEDSAPEVELASVARSYRLSRRSRPLVLDAARAVASRKPVSLAAFDDAPLRRFVAETLARRPIATIFAFSSQVAQFIPTDFAGRVVMDFVDVDSAKFEAYAAQAAHPMRAVHAREARLLAAHEAQTAARADVSLFVTEDEAALFRARLDAEARAVCDVRALGNGIDSARFNPIGCPPEPALAGTRGPHIVFTGQMDYLPNIAAAVRFATRVMPLIRREVPDALFHVVGRRPAPRVLALDGREGTRVWGRVADMRPWLAAADLVVAPLEIARGVQNKVLEAMAMARPVLASPEAATGIAASDGAELAIEASDAAMAACALRLFADPVRRAAMGQAARRFVAERQSWAATLAPLPAIVGFGERPQARHAA